MAGLGDTTRVPLRLRQSGVVLGLALSSSVLLFSGCSDANHGGLPTPQELADSRAATESWQASSPAEHGEIEGYASKVSVNRGESISLFVNTAEPDYTIEIYRMGWYHGAGAKLMMPAVTRAGKIQPIPIPDPRTGLIECNWADPFVLHIPDGPSPADWPSGVYLAKLTAGTSGRQSYIPFVVRDDTRHSDLLFQASVTTYQAYNNWGGKSLYTNPKAHKVSFNRPYARGHGSGDFLFWEYSLLRFLESQGYDVAYTTDVDTHARGDLLLLHKAFLSVGHDEYWSWQMRDNVETARERGVNLGFFAANVSYWQIRFEPSAVTADADRTILCYKSAKLDPTGSSPDPQIRRLTTTQFRLDPVNRPEDALLGMMYDSGVAGGDIVVEDASSWVFDGTGLVNGSRLPGLLGYEVDRIFDHAPAGTQRIAHSPYSVAGATNYGDMTVYEWPSGSTVVATGSMQWNWGLDEGFSVRGKKYVNPAAQQATRNILKRFGAVLHPPQ